MSAELKASRRDATLILTISNPGAMNTLDPDMAAAAIETLSTAERDDSVRVVVLTGAGNVFCAGGDLNQLLEGRNRDKNALMDTVSSLHGWVEAIRDCPKPVIAAVEGAAAGAGFSLALACDMIVAGMSAKFVMAHVKIGLTPDGGGSWFLTHALPRQIATEIMLEGKAILAPRLHELGLINKLVADGSALDAALAWADTLAELSPNAIEHIKALTMEAQGSTLAQHLEVEKNTVLAALQHRDSQEGISAFLEKRKPVYR